MEKFPMTAAGFDAIKKELQELISQRSEISDRIAVARELGDLKENAEYHAAREQQSFNEGKIAELEDYVARAEVINVANLSSDTVKFGATVTLLDDDTEKKVTYQIVGEYEANVEDNRISIASPLARAIIGKPVGEVIEFRTPKGERTYEILAIKYK